MIKLLIMCFFFTISANVSANQKITLGSFQGLPLLTVENSLKDVGLIAKPKLVKYNDPVFITTEDNCFYPIIGKYVKETSPKAGKVVEVGSEIIVMYHYRFSSKLKCFPSERPGNNKIIN